MSECRIDNDLVLPQLVIPCAEQEYSEKDKCFRTVPGDPESSVCVPVIKVLSEQDTGIVVVIQGPQDSYIMMWNYYGDDDSPEDLFHEIMLQYVAYTSGLSPKIVQFYQSQTTDDKEYVYVIMTDLTSRGYFCVGDKYQIEGKKFKSIPKKVTKAVSKALNGLHYLGISHNDCHPHNVFYNPEEDRAMIIDYGLATMYPSRASALRHEDFDFDCYCPNYWFPALKTAIIRLKKAEKKN